MTPAFLFAFSMALIFCVVAGYVVGYMRGMAHGSGVALAAMDEEMARLRAID